MGPGNNILEVVDNYTCLGLEVNNDGIGEEKQRRINDGKVRRMTGMIMNGGIRSINKYEVGRSLWKGVTVPHCLYGSEITTYREADLNKLEKTQNIIGRWSLGALNSTAVEALKSEDGLEHLQGEDLKRKT